VWRILATSVAFIACQLAVGAAVADEFPAPLFAAHRATVNTEVPPAEFQAEGSVIAAEPIPPYGTRPSAYDEAMLGREAPALVFTAGTDGAPAERSGDVIAPTADGNEVNTFVLNETCGGLPPITITDDIWCFFPRLGHDAWGLVNNWNNLAILGVALGGSLAIRSEWDEDVRNWTAEHPDRWGQGSKIIGDFGVAQYQIPFLLGGYLYTVYAQDYYQHDMMYSMISAYTLFGLSTVSIKYIADTSRPSDTWNGGKLGFPSWHDGSMFCMAAVLDDYEGHWIGYPLYILAGLIGWSRIDTRDHDLSDVVFGGVLGYVIGHSVSGKALFGDSRVHLLPYFNPADGAAGVMIDARF
jgi:hypothetical protein